MTTKGTLNPKNDARLKELSTLYKYMARTKKERETLCEQLEEVAPQKYDTED